MAVHATGLITAIGHTAAATCAALRARISNPSETTFKGVDGRWIVGQTVQLDPPVRGVSRLAHLAARAIDEAAVPLPQDARSTVPVLLCVAERDRPGRLDGLDDALVDQVQARAGALSVPASQLVSQGRVGAAVALHRARAMIRKNECRFAIVVGVDSLLVGPTLHSYDRMDRLMRDDNVNGFIPGEAAAAVLVGRATDDLGQPSVHCKGFGFGREVASIGTDAPLRADGLTNAMKTALEEAHVDTDEGLFRIADLSGEQYYFKEASLALSRAIPCHKENLQLWHPAESIGEAGPASALACLVVAHVAATKDYAPAKTAMLQFANDDGTRAVVITRSG